MRLVRWCVVWTGTQYSVLCPTTPNEAATVTLEGCLPRGRSRLQEEQTLTLTLPVGTHDKREAQQFLAGQVVVFR